MNPEHQEGAMKPNRRETISLLAGAAPVALGALSAVGITSPGNAQETKPGTRVATSGEGRSQKIETRIGQLEFTHDFANGYPTDATVEKLYDERDFQRGCQAYLWSLPAVSFASWQRGITKGLGAKNGQIVAILSLEARHPDRECHDAILSRVRRSFGGPVGHGDSAARRARWDQ
jgi:hypothetical protein